MGMLLKTSKMFREEGIRRLLNNQSVAFTHCPTKYVYIDCDVSAHVLWSASLSGLYENISPVPAGLIEADHDHMISVSSGFEMVDPPTTRPFYINRITGVKDWVRPEEPDFGVVASIPLISHVHTH